MLPLRRNVLIFHGGALGDFIVTWPLAMALGRLYPQSRIFYVVGGGKGRLAQRALGIESIDAEAGWHHLHSGAEGVGKLPEPARKSLAGAHTIVSFLGVDGDDWSKGLNAAASDARMIFLATKSPVSSTFGAPSSAAPDSGTTPIAPSPLPTEICDHVTGALISQLQSFPDVCEGYRQMLGHVWASGIQMPRSRASVAAEDRRAIVIHPGGGAREKCWPVDRFVELIHRLKKNGNNVRVIVGEVELDPAKWPAGDLQKLRAVTEVKEATTLDQLVDEVASAAVFIGNDSGPGHLAGILGTPTISLFGGGGDPSRWRPIGPRVRVIQGGKSKIDEIAVDAVAAGVSDFIKNAPARSPESAADAED